MVKTLGPGQTANPARDSDRHLARSCACLVVAFDAARPLDPPSRHWLIDVDEVSLGRSDKGRAWSRSTDNGTRRLRVRVPDALVSARHTTLRRKLTRWTVEDAGSTNGTIVNGKPTKQTVLASGDVIVIGGTFLVYREVAVAELPEPLDQQADDRGLVALPEGLRTLSPELERELGKVIKVARSLGSIVILGATGTGKELLARAVHAVSLRKGPLVPVNCGALPASLIESELFGHKAGAFSGAVGDRDGLITASDRGTLFLDEIGELSLAAQAALLRALQEGEVRPIGATSARKVDLRVVAATNCDLPALVKQKKFRADLWARLDGFTVTLPGLCERKEDLGLLVRSLLQRHTKEPAKVSLTTAAAAAMFAYDWPSNIRELDKAIERAATLAGSEIDLPHLPDALGRAETPDDEDEALRQELVALLRDHDGNVADVGRVLGKARQQIQKWCKRLGIDPAEFRDRDKPPG